MNNIEYNSLLEDLDSISNRSSIIESVILDGNQLVMRGSSYTRKAHKLVEEAYRSSKYLRLYSESKSKFKIIDTSKMTLKDVDRMITRYYRFGKILEAWRPYVKDAWSFQDYLDYTYDLINFDDKGYASWIRPNGKIYDAQDKLHPDMFKEMEIDSLIADDYANELGLVRFNSLGHNYIRLPDNYFTDMQLSTISKIVKYCLDTNHKIEISDYHNHYLNFNSSEYDYRYVLMIISNFYRTGKVTNDLNEAKCPTCSTLLEPHSISISYNHKSFEDICPHCKTSITRYNNGNKLVIESIRRLSEAYLDPDEKFYDYGTGDISGKDIFNTHKTGYSYYDGLLENPGYYAKNKGVKGEIVQMTPTEYFNRCAEGIKSTFDREILRTSSDKDTISHLKEVITKYHKKFPLTFLSYADGRFAQEGTHRMYVSGELLGWDTKFPVLIVTDV